MKTVLLALLLVVSLSCAADSPCRTDRGDSMEGDPCVSTGDCCFDHRALEERTHVGVDLLALRQDVPAWQRSAARGVL